MRLIVTADLHYDIARSKAPTEHLASMINRAGADALMIVGDTCGRDLGILRCCFDLFDSFPGRVFFVAGNHDIWTFGGDSLVRYEQELAEVCESAGVWYLDARPYLRDGIALVGSLGWYDYAFRRAELGIPMRFYEHKVAPGAAARLEEYGRLLDDRHDLTDAMLDITTRWMDGVYVHLPMSDPEFTRLLRDRMAEHLQSVASDARQIVVGIHHLPFEAMVRHTGKPNWDFANAFMGSPLFGELLLSVPNVHYVLCGHTHRPLRIRVGRPTVATERRAGPPPRSDSSHATRISGDDSAAHIECINVGSTYGEKRYETLELE
jgi:predicted phosphohydrolase